MANKKKQLTLEQNKIDIDMWIIFLVTFGVFACYAMYGSQLSAFVKDENQFVTLRLLVIAGLQFGIAGLGSCIVCLIRKERFSKFGLIKRNMMQSIIGTIVCYVPYVTYIFISDQFEGYRPLSVMISDDVIKSGFPLSVIGMLVIAMVWGFFEGFNYAVICDKLNKRYPSKYILLDVGAIACAVVCVLIHPFNTSFWGVIEIITTLIAIYGMLIVKKKTGNAWGCVFAFCFIWNAI